MPTTPDLAAVIAAAVRGERSRRHWTQAELATRLGWTRDRVGDLETGRRTVAVVELPELCRVFDVGLARLLQDGEPGDVAALRLAP